MSITYDEIMKIFAKRDAKQREAEERCAAEADRRAAEADRQMLALRKQMGEITGRIGQFIESMVEPALVQLFRERNLDVHEVHKHVTAKRAEGQIEIDLLVVNDGDVIAVECKSKLSIDDINEHIERMEKIKTLLPAYRHMRLLGAVATMVLDEHVGRYAYSKGFYVIAQNGETVEIKNDKNFRPNYW